MVPSTSKRDNYITQWFRLAISWSSSPSKSPDSRAVTFIEPKSKKDDSGLSSRAIEALEWFKETYKEQLGRISKPGEGYGTKPIDMMTAENWLCRDELVQIYKESVQKGLAAHHLSYAPGFGGDPALLLAAAGFYNAFFNPVVPVLPEQVIAGAGCSSLVASLVHDLCGIGEGILIEVPYWGGFEMECIMRAQTQMVSVDTTAYYATPEREPGQLVASYERALQMAKCPVRALLLCNPHNPRGQLYSVTELRALINFCHTHRLHLVSDEIYGVSTFGPPSMTSPTSRMYPSATDTFTPVMSLHQPDPSRVHTLHGISKDFGSSGLRLGFIVTQANPLLRMSLAISNHAKVSNVSALMAISLLSDHHRLGSLISASNAALRIAANVIVDFLVSRDVQFHHPVAGVFVWARLGGYDMESLDDEVEMSRAFSAAGVELVAGRSCRAPQPGWFRVTFALPQNDLLLGLERISGVLDVLHDKIRSKRVRT